MMGGCLVVRKRRLKRKHVQPQVVEEPQAPVNPKFTPKKGRPTPSRKEQQAARRQPLVVSDRKEAKAREREAMAKARERQNDALMGGDQRYLPAVDRGSQRRYIRDYVDARRNLGDFIAGYSAGSAHWWLDCSGRGWYV